MAFTETSLLTSTSPAPPKPVEVGELIRPITLAGDRTLPVKSQVAGLFPEGGLRRGSTTVVSGSTSLALATVAAASAQGSWCAAVGFPSLGLVAAAEMGIELGRFALVPSPGSQWAVVAAALLDALDVVMVRPPAYVRPIDVRRLEARARERGAVLVVVVDDASTAAAWPQADVRIVCESIEWRGLGSGHGHLKKQHLGVTAGGRGAASRPRHALVSPMAS